MSDDTPACRHRITALVLAGGRGRRLEGRDKGLVEVKGTPLVSFIIGRIRGQVDRILISANRNREAYASLGFEVVADAYGEGEFAGPLAGVLAGLDACRTDYLLVVPCDTPCLPVDLVDRLCAEMERAGPGAVTVHNGERLQPVVLLLRRSMAEGLRAWLENGGRAVQEWLSGLDLSVVEDDRVSAYRNINTQEELDLFAQTLCD